MSKRRRRYPGSIFRYVSAGFAGVAIGLLMYPAAGEDDVAPDQALSNRDLEIRYAQVSLSLAKNELQQAEKYNQDLARSIESRITLSDADKSRMISARQLSKSTIERLKSNVAVAEEQLKQAKLASTDGAERVLLRYTAEKVRLAKVRLELAQESKLRNAELRQMNVDRARFKYELAKLQLDMLKNPNRLNGALEALFLRTDRLSEDHVVLEQRIAALEDISVRQLAP